MSEQLLQALKENLVNGNIDEVSNNVKELVENGVDSKKILDEMISAMNIVGEKFSKNEYFLPDLILSGNAMRAGLDVILPNLKATGASFKGKVILGSVQGDVHDVGKSIVHSTLVGAGYEVIDLGVDVAPEVFAQKAIEHGVDVVGASAYMTTTTAMLPKVNEALKEAGIRDKVKFVIGGAATSEAYVEWAGADGWGETAWDAVETINNLLKK